MPNWPHAPPHRLTEAGAYCITAGTWKKEHHFRGPERLGFLHDSLLDLAEQYGWALQAWAVFSNHYHFVALSPSESNNLPRFLRHLHSVTAHRVNELDHTEGRKVWFQYWDTYLTFERSYLARLNYVHENAVKHGLTHRSVDYPWCSAAWFEQNAAPAWIAVVRSFRTDRIRVVDDF